jgi:hypothetical protein
LTVNGTVTLDHSTTLNFNLGPAGTTGSNDNDFINITGPLSLDGTLNVNALGGFGVGTYTLIDYTGALSGAGLSLGTTSGLGFNYAIDATKANEIDLDVTTQYAAGDTNHDGLLNSLDIDAIYQNLTVAPASYIGTWPRPLQPYNKWCDVNGDGAVTQADFNGDGVVDFLDFQILLNYWNPGGWNYAPSQTPEPASLTLILLGGAGSGSQKKKLLSRERKRCETGSRMPVHAKQQAHTQVRACCLACTLCTRVFSAKEKKRTAEHSSNRTTARAAPATQ